jgi:paraquat-inducible protein B
MKRLLLVFGLVFLYGCGPTLFQQDMAVYNQRFQSLVIRQNSLFSYSDKTNMQEKKFIKGLTDVQLVAYQQALQGFQSDQPTKEMSRRNLQQVCDANTYSTAMDLLEQRTYIRKEAEEVAKEHVNLRQMLNGI